MQDYKSSSAQSLKNVGYDLLPHTDSSVKSLLAPIDGKKSSWHQTTLIFIGLFVIVSTTAFTVAVLTSGKSLTEISGGSKASEFAVNQPPSSQIIINIASKDEPIPVSSIKLSDQNPKEVAANILKLEIQRIIDNPTKEISGRNEGSMKFEKGTGNWTNSLLDHLISDNTGDEVVFPTPVIDSWIPYCGAVCEGVIFNVVKIKSKQECKYAVGRLVDACWAIGGGPGNPFADACAIKLGNCFQKKCLDTVQKGNTFDPRSCNHDCC